MPEEKAKAVSLIESLDTTKTGIKAYLEDAALTTKQKLESAKAMRLAVCRFILDSAKISDAELRKQIWQQFDATPGWFGCNNSAGRQALGIESKSEKYFSEFDV